MAHAVADVPPGLTVRLAHARRRTRDRYTRGGTRDPPYRPDSTGADSSWAGRGGSLWWCCGLGRPARARWACVRPAFPSFTAMHPVNPPTASAASSAIAIFDDGDVGDAAKDIAFDTGSDFVMQAIGGNAVA